MARIGILWIAFAVFGWLARRPLLKIRGVNPRYSWDDNVFYAEGFYISLGLCGLGLLVADAVQAVAVCEFSRNVTTALGAACLVLGAATLAVAIQVLRRRRSPSRVEVAVATVAWGALLVAALLVSAKHANSVGPAMLSSGMILGIAALCVGLYARRAASD